MQLHKIQQIPKCTLPAKTNNCYLSQCILLTEINYIVSVHNFQLIQLTAETNIPANWGKIIITCLAEAWNKNNATAVTNAIILSTNNINTAITIMIRHTANSKEQTSEVWVDKEEWGSKDMEAGSDGAFRLDTRWTRSSRHSSIFHNWHRHVLHVTKPSATLRPSRALIMPFNIIQSLFKAQTCQSVKQKQNFISSSSSTLQSRQRP